MKMTEDRNSQLTALDWEQFAIVSVAMATLFRCVCLSALLYIVSTHSPVKKKVSEPPLQWWTVSDTVFHDKNQTMFLRYVEADEGKVHSCYEYKLFDQMNNNVTKLNTFCFPSIIIVGYKKCSTSALYALLSSHPQAASKLNFKENCPFDGKRGLDAYFDSLPATVAKNHMVISGCIYLQKILDIVDILRNPNAFYLVSYLLV